MYHYTAKIKRVIDGDTLEVTTDLGFGVRKDMILRLLGVDTDELHDHDPAKAQRAREAKAFTEHALSLAPDFEIHTVKDRRGDDKADTFNSRYLATVIVNGINLNETLTAQGMMKAGKA